MHNVTAPQLITGTESRWRTPETVGPMTTLVHRVNDEAEWKRVDALAEHWTRFLRRLGSAGVVDGSSCFFPEGVRIQA